MKWSEEKDNKGTGFITSDFNIEIQWKSWKGIVSGQELMLLRKYCYCCIMQHWKSEWYCQWSGMNVNVADKIGLSITIICNYSLDWVWSGKDYLVMEYWWANLLSEEDKPTLKISILDLSLSKKHWVWGIYATITAIK